MDQNEMKLGMEVGLGPGHIVLDGDSHSCPKRSTAPNFRPMSIVVTTAELLFSVPILCWARPVFSC